MASLSDIGSQLITARIAQGLSQRELAELVGVHQQQIARWEKERYGCVSLKRLSLVADALGVGEAPLLAAEAPAACGTAVIHRHAGATPVRDLGEVIARIQAHAHELHERFGVTRIDVFGSFAGGEQTPESDVDLIVEVAEPTLETVFGSEEWLSAILGRRADAGSFKALRPRVHPHVERERVEVWHA
ncbi:MAG TPA: helix-turn-helix domain-containing protein [Actinobacteria bacterium]|nr:helix-turn-helix domain-containing protein [Actinomycetota bacterium]